MLFGQNRKIIAMTKRKRIKHQITLEERLAAEAAALARSQRSYRRARNVKAYCERRGKMTLPPV